MPYNLEKADWKEFDRELKDSSNQAEFQWNPAASSQVEELEKHAENLQILIQKAAEKTIPKRKASSKTKPWWNDHISELRKTLSREKIGWKKSRTEENHEQYQQARNCYFNEIKMAKSNCWNQFLEKAEGKNFFKAFAYIKKKRIERLPIITYSDRNNKRKGVIIFNQKCDEFVKSLFYPPPS